MTDLAMESGDHALSDRRLAPRDGSRRGSGPAKVLGYLGLGVGLTGLVFARQLTRWLGIKHRRASRLTLTAMAALGGITAAGRSRALPAPKPVRRAITIAVPPEQVYAFWRDLENLPSFMTRLVSIEPFEARRSHWRAHGPAGTFLQWDAEIVEDLPNSLIRWQSLPDSVIRHQGRVRFRPAPGLRGTEVSLEVQYEAPGGRIGRWLSSLTREVVGIHFENDLRRLKQLLEVGEIVCSDASAHRGLHPARPEPVAKLAQKDGEP